MTVLEASSPAPAAGCAVQQMGVGGSSDTTSLGLWPGTRSGGTRARKASKPGTQGAKRRWGHCILPVLSLASKGMETSGIKGEKVWGEKMRTAELAVYPQREGTGEQLVLVLLL